MEPRPASDRRGSTLIVVIALLASLMLLGFLFLTISSQEQENAYLFSEASKIPQMAGSDYFDFVLELQRRLEVAGGVDAWKPVLGFWRGNAHAHAPPERMLGFFHVFEIPAEVHDTG